MSTAFTIQSAYRWAGTGCALAQLVFATMVCLVTCFYIGPTAADGISKEDKIKAAIVYKLGKFVEWPATAFKNRRGPLAVCLLGSDPMADVLAKAKKQTVQGHRIDIVTLGLEAVPTSGCHILYIPNGEIPELTQFLDSLSNAPVLTVSDTRGFARLGGMVGLIRSAKRLKFEINPRAAQQAGLKISAQLLELADIVE